MGSTDSADPQTARLLRLQTAFHDASELDPDARAAYLARLAAEDPALHAEVIPLLQHADAATRADARIADVIAPLASDLLDTQDADPQAHRIPGYRLVRQIGRGGMGTVFLAERDANDFHHAVAIKLVRGRASTANLERFRRERDLLASLRHPSIARLFDGGTTEAGQPYFVMELIDGSPITTYCDTHQLTLDARIALFIQVCEGVQHAHHKGVIHRDLKPGNILVTEVDGRPVPKIIDFGIATATGEAGAEGRYEQAGTPDYMSPEQAAPDPATGIDTRTDVYSLGVLLHELLTGRRPANPHSGDATPSSAPATRPSRRIEAGLADAGRAPEQILGVPRTRLLRLLRRELDWVVLKAMQRERSQRYSTVSELVADLRRLDQDLPLQAVPHTRRYVLGKTLRRHRVGVAAAAMVSLAVLGGLGVALHALREARTQRAIAEQRASELERVSAFQQSMLEGVDIQAMGIGLASGLRAQIDSAAPAELDRLNSVLARVSTVDLARHLLDEHVLAGARRAIARDFADQPALAADLELSVAKVQEALGLNREAAAAYEDLAIRQERLAGRGDPRSLMLRGLQASALIGAQRYRDANALLQQLIDDEDALGVPPDARLRHRIQLSETVSNLGDLAGARATQQALLDEALATREENDPLVLSLMDHLSVSMARMGDLQKARAMAERLLELRIASNGDSHDKTLSTMSSVAAMRAVTGDLDEALALQQSLVEIRTRALGAEHPVTIMQRANLANMLLDAKRIDESEALMRAVMDARTKMMGPDSPDVLRSKLNLSALLARRHRYADALALEQEVIDARSRLLGPEHPDTAFVLVNHGTTLRLAGRQAEAIAHFDRILPVARRALAPQHPQLYAALLMRGLAALDLGRTQDALPFFQEGYDGRHANQGPDHPETLRFAGVLAVALERLGRTADAKRLRDTHLAPHAFDGEPSTPQQRVLAFVAAETAPDRD